MRPTSRLKTVTGATMAAILLAACGGGSGRDQGPDGIHHDSASPSRSAPTAPASRADDVFFAQMMIPHHDQAVGMAELALDSSTASAEVRSLAEQSQAAMDAELRTLDGWLREWGAPAASSMGRGGEHDGMTSDHDMENMGAAKGAAFDTMWLTTMVEHDQTAVMMAQEILLITNDPEVTMLAKAMVDRQTAQIATMQHLLRRG